MAAALLAFPCGGRHSLFPPRLRLRLPLRLPEVGPPELRPRRCSPTGSSNLWKCAKCDASSLNPGTSAPPTGLPWESRSVSGMRGLWNGNVRAVANPTAPGSLAASFGRILLLGVLFLSLDFIPGGRPSRLALAAPAVTAAEAKSEAEQRGKARRSGQHVRNEGGNVQETDGAGPEGAGQTEEDLWRELAAADKPQLRKYMRVLQLEGELLVKHVDRAVDDYCFTQAALEGFAADMEADKKEEILNEKSDALVRYRRGLLSLAKTSRRVLERMEEILAPRVADLKEDERSKVEKIARDLEEMKSAFDEREALPKAAKIEPETKSAEALEITALVSKIELEQTLSRRLRILMQKLATRVFEPVEEDDSTLAQNLKELEDLICDESRWQQEDESTRTVLPGGRDGVKSLSSKEQEDLLIARDRVLDSTWFDERKNRWEMQTGAVLHAVQNKLVAQARIRQDRRAMYVTLKGSDQEYYVNSKLFHAEYKDFGGFHALYVKLIASGAKTSIEAMRIPLSEWDVERLLQLPFRIVGWLLEDFWNSRFVVSVRPWYFRSVMGAVEEVMIRFGFPVIQKVVPQKVRVFLGFELPEGAEAAEPTDIITWQQEAQKHVDARYAEGSGSPAWWISLPVRCYALGLPLLIVLRFVVGFLITPFRPQSLEINDAEWKKKKQEELIKKFDLQPTRETVDPIKSVFDKMKRVKRPEVSLDDFAGLDMIKEEILEIISFLKNPKLFREMGARAPRGVLISGESGTGKTTLALAIAAEARVPMIELQGSELEGGAWVGQGASNVRELFKTAREMAPLIIFMDDFDRFAGVRGATSDTRKQDHESLINQLLVELDGFETQEGVVLVATTSRPDAIDEALRRPGRMDRTIELPMPNRREREQILRQAAHKTMDAHLIDYVDWAKVAEKTAGLTPARLKYVPEGLEGSAVSFKIADEEELFSIYAFMAALNKASPRWLKESRFTKKYNDMLIDWLGLRVTKEDMEDAVEYLDVFGESRPGIELFDPPYVWTREFKFPHAVWAVGKGLIAHLLPDFDRVDMIWLDPQSYEGIGFTKFTKKLDGGYRETGTVTRSYYEKELVSYFGSFAASRMLLPFGENNTLCKFEMNSAKEIATRMVIEYGWAPDDSPMIYMVEGSEGTLAMGDDHERQVSSKVNDVFYRACDKAFHMLEQNRPVLEAMLEHLVEFDVLNREDLEKIVSEKGAVFEELPFSIVPYSRTEVVGASTNGTGRSGKESPVSALG